MKKRPFVVHNVADALTCAKNIQSASLAPIFLTSAVTGRGLDLLRCFLNLLPQVEPRSSSRGEALNPLLASGLPSGRVIETHTGEVC